jgi:DNA-binding NtrC family response regulator
MTPSTVLVVDDDQLSLDFMRMLLSNERFSLYTARSAAEALDAVRQVRPRLVFLDLILPDGNGLDLLTEFLRLDPTVAVILVTGQYSIETAVKAIQGGAYDYFSKPIDLSRLKTRVDAWVEAEQARQAQASAGDTDIANAVRVEGFVGNSDAMRGLFSRVQRAARHFSAALVTGDSGTGKELVARSLHTLSSREGPFVVCNCSAIPESLFESQLFGHVKGAFTGATRDEAGFVASAQHGTLFLDEIGELPLSLQPKLLRFLQNGEIQRVGSPALVRTNARVVAATNRDLLELVRKRTFREDLYYRLAMVQFRIPPLSERMEDFPLLLRHFLTLYATQYAKPALALTPEAERILRRHSWPGNVRELQNVLGYACMMAQRAAIEISDFPDWWVATLGSPATTVPSRDRALQSMGYDHIQQVLKECDGNRTRAAKVLGIGRATLYRALAKPPAPVNALTLSDKVARQIAD